MPMSPVPGSGSATSLLSHVRRVLLLLLGAACLVAVISSSAAAHAAPRDRDRDKLPDRWETRYKLPTHKKSARGDADRDGLRNKQEFKLRTHPRRKDTDRDGLRDKAEVRTHKTNPRRKDTDRDGLRDKAELRTHGTDPRKPDTDADGLTDKAELERRTNPRAADSDGDGVNDGDEVRAGSDPNTPDQGGGSDDGGSGQDGGGGDNGQGGDGGGDDGGDSGGDDQGGDGEGDDEGPSAVDGTGTVAPADCDLTANPGTFNAQIAATSSGEVLCLTSGEYGTWTGTSKAVTIAGRQGETAEISFDFNTGDHGFTLDGLTVEGAEIVNGAHDITVRRSRFTGFMRIDGLEAANVLFDNNTHNDIMCNPRPADPDACDPAARIHLSYWSPTPSGVTIANSQFIGGNSDGIQTGVGVNIIGNEFRDIRETGAGDPAHTDAIQLIGAPGAVVRGNYITGTSDGIVAYDGLERALIEDNVIDLVNGRYGIELYADDSSVVRHNTLVYGTGCSYAPCGLIILGHKPHDPAGHGTVIVDNIATRIDLNDGSTAAERHGNLLRQGASAQDFAGSPVFTGGAFPDAYSAFKLTAGSPGRGAAAGGADVGARIP